MLAIPVVIRQHLIDPEICIRCNTCEESCPIDAVTHDSRNYVVRADVCNGCGACIPPCPTGAIDNWRLVIKEAAYPIEEQLLWDELPLQAEGLTESISNDPPVAGELDVSPPVVAAITASIPPRSASHAATNLYAPDRPIMATVVGNHCVTEPDASSQTHHIVLDFGSLPFPLLEGQSVGVIPPGVDANGRAHHARQYSVASPRDGERLGYSNFSLTVKRVTVDHDGNPVLGVCSNYLCNLARGDKVKLIGPFGSTFLMPTHAGSHVLMICTGTGSAPMRAMTEYRRRHRAEFADAKLMLFFGARTQGELPYFGPLMTLPGEFIDINLAFSRATDTPRRYVQDLIRERSKDVGSFISDNEAHIYVCGLKSMEGGVLDALRVVASETGADWDALHARMRLEGRIHFETY